MSEKPIVIIGAGIVGVSTAIWLRRAGRAVILLDKGDPGQATSYGNACILANSSVVPVTVPGLVRKAPGYMMNPDFPLFMRWSYLPRMIPWLVKYLGHANDADTRRITRGLTDVVGDGVEQHKALAEGLGAAKWIEDSDYSFAYTNRAAFEADAYVWNLRAEAGFVPELLEGEAAREYEPNLGPSITLIARLKDHGYIRDPGLYVAELARNFQGMGGEVRKASFEDFEMEDGRVAAVLTSAGRIECDRAVVTTGAWSKPIMKKLGLNVALESERGYHIVFENPENGPRTPLMIASGKFVATPMAQGLRCAGVVEFGGLEAGPSKAPLDLLRRKVAETFPNLKATREVEWQGHRPATSDSLPLIGEVGQSGVFAGFGHQHIGLTGGPKTGRLLAQIITGQTPNLDLGPFDPQRYAR